MRLSHILNLYRVRLRPRLVHELLAVAGIAIGVALVFAALVANTSLTGSVHQLVDGVVGQATIQVTARGPEGFDERLVARIQATDGVEAAAPVLEARANVRGPLGRESVLLVAGDHRFAGLGGTLLPNFDKASLGHQAALALPGPIADEIGVSVGQLVPVEVAPRTVEVPLGAQLRESDIGELVDSPVALVPLQLGQEMTGLDRRVSRVFVKAAPGREAGVEMALNGLAGPSIDVRPAMADVTAFERAAYPTSQSTALFSVFSALVGFLFAFSAVLLTVPQRQRLIADLQMAGHPPWALIKVLLFDAFVLGALGSILGILAGDQLSRTLFGSAPDYLSAAFPVGSQQVVTWQSAAIAAGAGLAAAVVAVLAPLRKIVRRHPLVSAPETEGHGRGDWALVLAGIACMALTSAIIVTAPEAAILGIVALTLGLLLLLPMLLRLATAAFSAVAQNWHSPVPTLVVLELRSPRARTRTLALAATGAIAVFATVAIGGGNSDLRRGLEESARQIDGNTDVWVTFAGEDNTLGTTRLAGLEDATDDIRRLPEVAAVHRYRGGFLDVGDQRAWVLAPPSEAPWLVPPSQVRAGDPAMANERVRSGSWVALSEAVADELGVSVGDSVRLPTPVPTRFRVAAITTNLAWPPGAIVTSADAYRRAWGTDSATALQVDLASGVPPGRGARAVASVIGDRTPVTVETAHERTLRHYATARDALWRLTQISGLVLVSAALAMAAAMGGMIWQRRPSVARLKVHGFPESQLWAAQLLESGLLLGTGCLVGAAFGLYGQVLVSRALEAVTGFPVVYATAAVSAAGILALVTAIALAMLALPGWLAVRVDPAPGE